QPHQNSLCSKNATLQIPRRVFTLRVYEKGRLTVLKKDFRDRPHETDFSPRIVDFFVPNPFIPVTQSQLSPISMQDRNIEHVVAFGLFEILLFIIIASKYKNQKEIKVLIVLFSTFFMLALGTISPEFGIKLPYSYLDFFPFTAIDEPGRFSYIANLFLLMTIALGLKNNKLKKNFSTIILFIIFIIILERISPLGYTLVQPYTGKAIQKVKDLPGKAVLNIPLNEPINSFYPFFHQKSIVSGYAHFLADTEKSLSFIDYEEELKRFFCSSQITPNNLSNEQITQDAFANQKILKRLKDNDVQSIVVHKDSRLFWPRCYRVLAYLSHLTPGIQIAEETSGKNSTTQYFWAAKSLESGLFFPKDGTLQLSSISVYPAPPELSQVNILLNGKKIEISSKQAEYLQRESGEYELFLTFYDEYILKKYTKAGSNLEITSLSIPQEKGVLTIWYSYYPDFASKSKIMQTNSNLIKIYNDSSKDIYQIQDL
ncbi:MAG: hypothetical protein ABFQ62_04385, partial [Patescibacteria group bacterium]